MALKLLCENTKYPIASFHSFEVFSLAISQLTTYFHMKIETF